MRLTRNALASLAACLFLSAVPGCGLLGSDSSSDDGRDTLGAGDRIPTSADVVEEGRGALSYTATDDGTIYVQDADTKATILRHAVERGDRVRVEFDDDRISVDDEAVYSGNLERENEHRIYFAREGRTASQRRADR